MSYPHHHHHHQPAYVQEEEYECEAERVYAAPAPPQYYERVSSTAYYEGDGGQNHRHPNNNHPNYQRNERLGELGAVAAGAFALYEGHKAKVDPQHAAKHKHEAEAAALGAVGSAGYAYHEHREKNKFVEEGGW